MSQTTKKALAASLKKLLEKQPLSKITVTDITEDCEVNRHTFYYHFQDVYDLIDWIYENEAIKPLDGKTTPRPGSRAFCRYLIMSGITGPLSSTPTGPSARITCSAIFTGRPTGFSWEWWRSGPRACG